MSNDSMQTSRVDNGATECGGSLGMKSGISIPVDSSWQLKAKIANLAAPTDSTVWSFRNSAAPGRRARIN